VVPTFPGGRNLIKQAYALRNVAETINICIASLSASSLRQYDSALKKWWIFCYQTETPVLSATIPELLRFLTSEFQNGAAYGSINSLRSAIALILGPHIGEDSPIRRFCKGASKLRPAQPKYNTTWDPKTVL
jgi:hypothetical protein